MLFGIKESTAAKVNKVLDVIENAVPYVVGGAIVFLLVWMVGMV